MGRHILGDRGVDSTDPCETRGEASNYKALRVANDAEGQDEIRKVVERMRKISVLVLLQDEKERDGRVCSKDGEEGGKVLDTNGNVLSVDDA